MATYSLQDVNFIKLKSLKKDQLRSLCNKFSISKSKDSTAMIKNILSAITDGTLRTAVLNQYIKELYCVIRAEEERVNGATHSAIIEELNKIDGHIWGMVQGAVDAHIQANYVRKFFKHDEVLNAIRSSLFSTIESYTLCTWYNHWSTVFLEDLICANKNVVPIIKKIKGVDIIWNEQPVDIKVTNLPKEWFDDGRTIDNALADPVSVCEYMYRLQGAQRFGSENRLFIVAYDKNNPSESWKIKRNYELIKRSVNEFFDQHISLDTVNFSYHKTQHQAHAKALFIVI